MPLATARPRLRRRGACWPSSPARPNLAPPTPSAEPQDDSEASQPDSHIELARERLRLTQRALGVVRDAARKGANIINQSEDYYRWSYRMLGDQIYLSMADDDPRVADPEVYLAVSHARPSRDRLAAFEAHVRRMEIWEDQMRPSTSARSSPRSTSTTSSPTASKPSSGSPANASRKPRSRPTATRKPGPIPRRTVRNRHLLQPPENDQGIPICQPATSSSPSRADPPASSTTPCAESSTAAAATRPPSAPSTPAISASRACSRRS